MAPLIPPQAITITILSPEKTIFTGQVRSITCYNKEGEFDILGLHSNFISLIYKAVVIHALNGTSSTITIGTALLKSMSDEIQILTDIDISAYSEILTAAHPEKQTATPKK